MRLRDFRDFGRVATTSGPRAGGVSRRFYNCDGDPEGVLEDSRGEANTAPTGIAVPELVDPLNNAPNEKRPWGRAGSTGSALWKRSPGLRTVPYIRSGGLARKAPDPYWVDAGASRSRAKSR